MPTEARGNYLAEAPYLRETKTYLNYMHASESTLDSGTSGTATEKKILYFRRPPSGLRPVAFATSATWLIRH